MTALLLAGGSGLLYAASFPPLELSPIAWIALAPLFLAIARARPGQAFLLGVLWFLIASLGFAASLPHLVVAYFEVPPLVGWAALAALTLLFGPLYGAYAAWMSWLVGRGAANPLVAAAGFGACELVRAGAGAVFGWALLAYSQPPGSRILQAADLGGPHPIGMLLVAASFALAAVASRSLRVRHRLGWALATGATICAGLLYGDLRLRETFASGEAARIAVVQGGIPHDRLWKPEHRAENLSRYLELTGSVAAERADLVVWPEYAIDFYLDERTPHRERLRAAARDLSADLLLGAPTSRLAGDVVLYHNSAYVLREGFPAGRHDKAELLPFSEENPLPGLIPPYRRFYAPGERPRPLRAAGLEVGVLLCSEALRPAAARELSRQGAEILANLSNDSWFGSRAAARIASSTAALRSIENRRPLVRATGGGFSAIVDAHGRIVASSGFETAETLVGTVHSSSRRTLYQRLGDAPVWIVVAVVVLLASLRSPPRS